MLGVGPAKVQTAMESLTVQTPGKIGVAILIRRSIQCVLKTRVLKFPVLDSSNPKNQRVKMKFPVVTCVSLEARGR